MAIKSRRNTFELNFHIRIYSLGLEKRNDYVEKENVKFFL